MFTTFARLREQRFEEPGFVKPLLGSPVMGVVWFFLRVYLGWQWLSAGWHKVSGDSGIGWVRDGAVNGRFVNAGDNILGFWTRAAAIPQTGKPPITYDWYRDFLQFMIDHRWNGWMAYVIAYGEVLLGLALVLGAFTGFAAFFGATMNFNFMLAGSASTNPLPFAVALLMVLAWKVAGYVGLDRWLLPALGTPWQAGRLFHRTAALGRRAGRTAPMGAAGD